MKLTWMLVVILTGALGVYAGYEFALAREHQRLEKNKELVRLTYQWFSEENQEARDRMAHQIYADKTIEHDGYGDRTIGPNGRADEMSETHADFSGWSEHPETMVTEGDYVAVRSWAGGKQVKDLAAVPPGPAVPNRGRSLRMQESIVFRIADGRVVEQWLLNDGWDVYAQLGLFDPDHWPESVCRTDTKR